MITKQQSLMDLTVPPGITKVEKIVHSYQIFQVLLVAVSLGLFDYLAKEGASDRKAIAENIGINGAFSRFFLDSMVENGLLNRDGESYSNNDIANTFLVSTSPLYQGNWIKENGHGDWSNLEEVLKRQQPQGINGNGGNIEALLKSQEETLLRGELQAVTKTIAGWSGFKNARTLLDLDGGHGLYTIALCQANHELKGIIFDEPEVIKVTKKYIDKYDISGQISTAEGNIETDSFGAGFDIIIVSHLLYRFRRDIVSFFNRVYKALNPGGLMVVNHWFCAPGCSAEDSSVKELSKSLQAYGHPLCHVENFCKNFENAGFDLIVKSEAPSALGTSLLQLATKGEVRKVSSCGSSGGCCG
jgi:SAM-dependent methyltransferase